ncbi:MAG: tetratricopeptide repeat protein [Planctomycetota bacterium]
MSNGMKQGRNKLHILLICVALVLATVIAFEPVRHNKFIGLDDDLYIVDNSYVKAGLTREGFVWAFTTAHAFNWHPLTWVSHMLDCEFYGLNPVGHHFTNVLFHIVNALLLLLVFNRMTGNLWASAFVAAVFALHPLHIESVAWASERKDVLSTFFWMLTMWAYVQYTERPNIGWYLLVALALCLGLMAKQMLVTLPFVLLLLDFWPLGRFTLKGQSSSNSIRAAKHVSIQRCILEKLPLLILSAAASVIVYLVQQSTGLVKSGLQYPLTHRIGNAIVAYIAYIGKMFWPSKLAVFYPHPRGDLPTWQIAGAVLLLVCVTAVVVWKIRQRPYLAVGWLWYLGTLVPVIGLVQIGTHAIADRYTYVPSTGIFIMVAWGAAELLAKWSHRKAGLGITAGVVLAVLLLCTRVQLKYWQNSFILYERSLAVTENNFIMHNLFGNKLFEKGRFDEAIMHFDEVLRIRPQNMKARYNKGRVFLEQGKFDEAVAVFAELLRIERNWPEVQNYLGLAYARKGQFEQAIKHFAAALQLRPDWYQTYNDLGLAYSLLGKHDLAIQNYKEALRLKPDYHAALNNLKMALEEQSKINRQRKKAGEKN